MNLPPSSLISTASQMPLAQLSGVSWILPALLTISTFLAVWKLQRWDVHYSVVELKWFVFLALLIFPLSFLHIAPFDGELLTLTGENAQPVVLVLSALPILLAV